jgi:processive rubber oxygenase RoxA-like protein
VEFLPPPPTSALVAEQGTSQLIGQLHQVGTFNAAKPWELIGTGANISKQALGASGYNIPSLRGIGQMGAPYLHDGSAPTLVDVLANPTHVGTSPLLQSPNKVRQLVRFVHSIDDRTAPLSARDPREDIDRRN